MFYCKMQLNSVSIRGRLQFVSVYIQVTTCAYIRKLPIVQVFCFAFFELGCNQIPTLLFFSIFSILILNHNHHYNSMLFLSQLDLLSSYNKMLTQITPQNASVGLTIQLTLQLGKAIQDTEPFYSPKKDFLSRNDQLQRKL